MTIAIRNTVRTAKEFTRWAAQAAPGSAVTYHIGNLAADRAQSHDLHELAETVLIFVEHGFVTTSQVVMRLAVGSSVWFSAVRTGSGRAPRSILFGQCDPFAFRALEALRDRESSQTFARAISEHMGCSGGVALDYLALLWARGWIESVEPKGYRLTAEGLRMLT